MRSATRVVRAVLIGLATALAAGPAAARAGAVTPAEILPPGLTVGLQDDHLAVDPVGALPARVATVASTGVTVARVDVFWADVAPTRPADPQDPNDAAYRWARVDAVVDAVAARGVAPILDLYRSPAWANGGRGAQWAPDPDDYGAFVTALARRYSGAWVARDGVVHARVVLYEAWNEPTIPSFLSPQWAVAPDGTATPASPAIYASLLTRAYEAVKRVQPDAWVIGVSGAPNGSNNPPTGSMGIITFLQALAPLAPPMDAASQHLYPALAPSVSVAMPSFRRLPEEIAAIDAVRPGLPILITEMGWTTAAASARRSFVTEDEQAANLREAVDMLRAEPRVRLAVWFNLQDNPGWPAGLLRADGTAKPSWDVFLGLPKFSPAPVPPPAEPASPPAPAEAPPAGEASAAPLGPSPAVPAPLAAVAGRPRPVVLVTLRLPAAARAGARVTALGRVRLGAAPARGGTCALLRGSDGPLVARAPVAPDGACRLTVRAVRAGRLGLRLRWLPPPRSAAAGPALSPPAVVAVRAAARA